MPLTRDFRETVLEDMKDNPDFARAMLNEGIEALRAKEFAVGKSILRDYVNATLGFEKLSRKVKIPVKSLMRMLGPSGNPSMNNIFTIIAALEAHAGIDRRAAAE